MLNPHQTFFLDLDRDEVSFLIMATEQELKDYRDNYPYDQKAIQGLEQLIKKLEETLLPYRSQPA